MYLHCQKQTIKILPLKISACMINVQQFKKCRNVFEHCSRRDHSVSVKHSHTSVAHSSHTIKPIISAQCVLHVCWLLIGQNYYYINCIVAYPHAEGLFADNFHCKFLTRVLFKCKLHFATCSSPNSLRQCILLPECLPSDKANVDTTFYGSSYMEFVNYYYPYVWT